MRKVMTGSLIALLILVLGTVSGIAGNGKGQVNGQGTGSGDCSHIFDGSPFNYYGDVVSIGPQVGGLVMNVNGQNITINGIGPNRYWASLGISKPTVGETIEVFGYTVDYNGQMRNIAVSMILGDDSIQLRDPDTGCPLWRRASRQGVSS